MAIDKGYSPEEIEDKWYHHWETQGYFHSEPDEREAFSVVIPPPNVTGVLHMGHMLNNTIQDVLVRKARLEGKNACWVPGTDHASIATEAKVVRMLREQGIKKSDLTRDEFLEHAWKWKEEYGGKILTQLRKLGASCDWERTSFTMDEVRSEAVIKAFVDLFNKGKLYRGKRMVNWDPEAQTVLSNEEVIYNNERSNLYHIRYQIEGEEEFVTIATTRPETILGDSAVAVHPDDERYTHLEGKKVIVPLVNRPVPIIRDDYVEIDFGTGALKVTPAHDQNDYEIGLRHNLEVIDVLNDNGTMSEAALLYIGEDRFAVRKKIVKELEAKGHLILIEDLDHNVGRSERTNSIVEPKLSLQWYVDMKALAEPALKAVMEDEVEFFPKNQKNVYSHWMTNIRDWCISRQLWWGHRIPAWFYGDDVFVATTAEEALSQAREKTGNPNLQMEDLRQDEDVLDTWFSSWLWPISVFDGFNNREELDYYYPTSVLVTGWDIIFLWVARMVMAGYEWEGKRPFDHVYFTGMVRDQKRRKMSKSLGNSPDALELINTFGADGVRFGMLSCSPAGGDLLFDDKLCDQGRKFSNKLWNAFRMIDGLEVDVNMEQNEADDLSYNLLNATFDKLVAGLNNEFDQYRLSEALINIYTFTWTDFCSWYLELIKPGDRKICAKTKDQAVDLFEKICIVLHPFMPFITEELWHQLKEREKGDDCMVSSFPKGEEADAEMLTLFQRLKDITTNVRDIRNKNQLGMREPLSLKMKESDYNIGLFDNKGFIEGLTKLAGLKDIELVKDEPENGVSFIAGKDNYFIILEIEIDLDAELKRLEEELEYAKGFIVSVAKKLSNESFVNNAPQMVVDKERQKMADGEARVALLEKAVSETKGKMN